MKWNGLNYRCFCKLEVGLRANAGRGNTGLCFSRARMCPCSVFWMRGGNRVCWHIHVSLRVTVFRWVIVCRQLYPSAAVAALSDWVISGEGRGPLWLSLENSTFTFAIPFSLSLSLSSNRSACLMDEGILPFSRQSSRSQAYVQQPKCLICT